jgi:uncharacterized protein YlzI (FlbEa/FlbD family)
MIKITTCGGTEVWLNADSVESVRSSSEDGTATVTMMTGARHWLDRSEADRLLELLGALPGAAETAETVSRGDGETMCSCLNDDQLAAVMRSQGFMPCENKPGHWFWPPDGRIIAFPTAATNTALVSGSGATAGKRAWSYHAVFRLPDGSKAERLNVHLSKLCETLMSANVEWRPDP